MADRDRKLNRESLRHGSDEGVHILKEPVVVLLLRAWMAVVVRRRIGHGDVLKHQRNRRGSVQLQLV